MLIDRAWLNTAAVLPSQKSLVFIEWSGQKLYKPVNTKQDLSSFKNTTQRQAQKWAF
jgi:hypothetical protein